MPTDIEFLQALLRETRGEVRELRRIVDRITAKERKGIAAYGSMYTHGTSVTISSAGVYYNVPGMAQGQVYNVTFSAANDDLTLDLAGKYLITYDASVYSTTANVAWLLAVGINGSADGETLQYVYSESTTAVQEVTAATVILDLAASDTVELMIAGVGHTNNPFVDEAHLTLVKVG